MLREFDGPVGILLRQAVRDLMRWAEARPGNEQHAGTGSMTREASPHTASFAVCTRAGMFAEAETWGGISSRNFGREHPKLPGMMRDMARLWVECGQLQLGQERIVKLSIGFSSVVPAARVRPFESNVRISLASGLGMRTLTIELKPSGEHYRWFRGSRKVVLGVLTASVLLACTHRSAPQQQHSAGLSEHCQLREITRTRLVDDAGRQVYIQPVAAATNAGGEVLLAGERNFVFAQNTSGKWARAVADSVFGVIVSAAGPAQIVPSPVPTRLLGAVRAVAQPDGTWAVAFAELKPYSGEIRPDAVARLWFGVLDGRRWATLESLPVPASGVLRAGSATDLIEKGGSFAWAFLIGTPQHPADVVIFNRATGRWNYEIVPTVIASYAALAYSDDSSPVVAIVQPDLSLENDGNSLFLWARQPDWRQVRKLVASSDEQVHDPQFAILNRHAVLTWEAHRAGTAPIARMLTGEYTALEGSVGTLDSAVAPGSRRILLSGLGVSGVWAFEHAGAVSGQRVIRFVRPTSKAVSILGEIQNPFVGSFASVAATPSEALVAGGIQDRTQNVVVTLVVRIGLRCNGQETS